MADGTTNILGILVPSTDSAFLVVVGVHVAFGIAAVGAGLVAMLSAKGRGRHARFGTIYFWALAGVSVSMSVLSFARWVEDYHLFILGVLSFAAAFWGRYNIRRGNVRLHLTGMGASYILLLTAFYVDNGKNLPVWHDLPPIAFWLLPSAIGLSLMTYYLVRLPKFRLENSN